MSWSSCLNQNKILSNLLWLVLEDVVSQQSPPDVLPIFSTDQPSLVHEPDMKEGMLAVTPSYKIVSTENVYAHTQFI